MNEKWKEIYTVDQIRQIQAIELLHLQELIRVCDLIGVRFFLYGGSLIGAVRHQGFVPWDDDLDIAMFREDYNKFLAEAPKYLSGNFYLQDPYSDKKSPYYYTKLRYKGTKCVEYGTHRLNIEHGIYVDIYPIDNMPDDKDIYMKNYNKFRFWVRLFVFRQCPYRYTPTVTVLEKIKAVVRALICITLRLLPHTFYLRRIERIEQEYNSQTTEHFGNYSYFDPTNLFTQITPFVRGQFEGFDVNLPKCWHEHLTSRYGNYMEMPAPEDRFGHIPYLLQFPESD